LYEGAKNVTVGPGFTQSAMDSVLPGFDLTLLLLPCFSSLYYDFGLLLYCRNKYFVFDKECEITNLYHLLKVVMMLVIMYGSINQAKLA
jgi:AGCS family alanine or glycine:cation symporter